MLEISTAKASKAVRKYMQSCEKVHAKLVRCAHNRNSFDSFGADRMRTAFTRSSVWVAEDCAYDAMCE